MVQETVTFLLKSDHADERAPVEIPRRVGHVKIGEMLGEGGGGVVFVGFDEMLSRRVAVKFLHRARGGLSAAGAAEMADGIRVAACVKHPNIVTVHTVEIFNAMPVVVMEYIDGVSLRDLLARSGALEYSLAVFVMRSIVSAVATLHAANVVHRDLKPANVLFDRGGEAHVCDFGLACEFDTSRFRGPAQHVGGTPLYMSPEMFDGHISPQSDVYALGVMLFEVLAGAPPFTADSMEEMRAAHDRGEIPMQMLDRRRTPEEARDVIRRAMNGQRFLRFKTAGNLLRALEELRTPESRADLLRAKISSMVAARPGAAAPTGSTPTMTMTTADLLAERARQKRQDRGV